MSDEILYREELLALRALVEDEIRRNDPANFPAMVGLGGLHMKLEKLIESAPSARMPKDAS